MPRFVSSKDFQEAESAQFHVAFQRVWQIAAPQGCQESPGKSAKNDHFHIAKVDLANWGSQNKGFHKALFAISVNFSLFNYFARDGADGMFVLSPV